MAQDMEQGFTPGSNAREPVFAYAAEFDGSEVAHGAVDVEAGACTCDHKHEGDTDDHKFVVLWTHSCDEETDEHRDLTLCLGMDEAEVLLERLTEAIAKA